jgi:hypothetical protein
VKVKENRKKRERTVLPGDDTDLLGGKSKRHAHIAQLFVPARGCLLLLFCLFVWQEKKERIKTKREKVKKKQKQKRNGGVSIEPISARGFSRVCVTHLAPSTEPFFPI